MFTKPVEVPDVLWNDMLNLISSYQALLQNMVYQSTGIDSHAIGLIEEKMRNNSDTNELWNIIEIHYPFMIHMAKQNTVTKESLKRGKVASYYNAALEIALKDNIKEPENEAYSQTVAEFSDEFFHYIELFPSFVEDAKNLYTDIK